MRISKTILALCGVFGTILASAATLTGTVKTEDGKAMEGVLIRVLDDANNVLRRYLQS